MKKRFFALVMVAVLLCLAACGRGGTIRLGTGDKGGTYFTYGKVMSALSEEGTFELKNTAGSAANIRLVKEGFLDMAIVQSDTLANAYNGRGDFSESGPVKGLSAVAALYTEACQIIVRADSDIYSIANLQDKVVSVGELESGTLENATQILSVAGLKTTDVNAVNLSFTDSAAALKNGEIDAFFCTALVGMHVVDELDDTVPVRVIGLEEGLIQRLMNNYNGYTRVTIPAKSYKGQNTDVSTVGVKAVLIASNKLSNAKVQDVLHLIFDNAGELAGTCKLHNVMDVDFATKDIQVPFHEGTAEFYANSGVNVNTDSAQAENAPVAGQDD